jgi:hypothetical protein
LKLVTMQFPSSSYHALPLRFKYFLQRPFLEHSQFVTFLEFEGPSFTPKLMQKINRIVAASPTTYSSLHFFVNSSLMCHYIFKIYEHATFSKVLLPFLRCHFVVR